MTSSQETMIQSWQCFYSKLRVRRVKNSMRGSAKNTTKALRIHGPAMSRMHGRAPPRPLDLTKSYNPWIWRPVRFYWRNHCGAATLRLEDATGEVVAACDPIGHRLRIEQGFERPHAGG